MSVEAKQAKQLVIDEIKSRFDSAISVVVVDYLGLTVAEADELRTKLRDANVGFTVYKNTLVKRAIEGTDYASIADCLKGSSAFAFCEEDATASARVLSKAIKEYNKMEFKGGIVEGVFYDKGQIEELASIPSREELIARFMGSIQSPLSQLVRTFAAIADANPEEAAKEEAPAAEAAPAEEAPAAEAAAEEAAPAEEATEEAAAEEAAPAEEASEEAAPEEAPAEEAAPEEALAEEAEAPAEEA